MKAFHDGHQSLSIGEHIVECTQLTLIKTSLHIPMRIYSFANLYERSVYLHQGMPQAISIAMRCPQRSHGALVVLWHNDT